jgi:pimeloyl-ACP methyl ester carboxylesterase
VEGPFSISGVFTMRLGFMVLLAIAACCGCAVPQQQLLQNAEHIAAQGGLQRSHIDAGPFRLTAFARLSAPHQPVRFYLEGDGKAWVTRRRVSLDPTPHDPVALRLAATDTAANVVYLARPCQFVSEPDFRTCNPHDWTDQRYAPRIVAAMNEAVEYFKTATAAEQVELAGFSGGGALAVLIAARRDDVVAIRTVAANLDIEAFVSIHRISPLTGSLNPSDFAHAVADIPQLHLVGEHDSVVPLAIAERFQQHLPHRRCVSIRTIQAATHQSGWAENWPALAALPSDCTPP